MQGAVKNNPQHFTVVTGAQGGGIVFNPVCTDVHFGSNAFALAQVERNDIRVIIMLQVIAVYLEQVIIGAKNIADFTEQLFFLFKQGFDESF